MFHLRTREIRESTKTALQVNLKNWRVLASQGQLLHPFQLDRNPMGNPPSYAQSITRDNVDSQAAPPNLPPRSPTSPVSSPTGPPALPSRETSIKRKPLSRTASINLSEPTNASNATHMDGDVQGGRLSSSPQASEAVNEERRIGMMEGASWGGGYNE